ncbi:uncharacterized protein LOC132256394 [Phlebotomus argentipes]|uniref:uncharacterized protein LOC132256394 n=1 Tax=Phlebotomus argentipes TaxID=94469 RepID=UPI002892C975|nr:uncharacterized protein LOC132256394 [Phlebotomus argentipes]
MLVGKVGVLVFALVAVITGQIAHHPPSTNPDFPGHCWLEDFKKALKGDESWTDRDNCVLYSCSADDFSYQISGCGALQPSDPECVISAGDNTKDFPDCCARVSCK